MKFPVNICLVLSLFFYTACQKDKFTYYPMENAQLKEAATVKKGSWFVYVDSLTNSRDTFNVTMWQDVYSEAEYVKKYELVHYSMHNSKGASFFLSAAANTNRLSSLYSVEGLDDFSTIFMLIFPFSPMSSESGGKNKWDYLEHYDTLTIRNKLYTDVYETISSIETNLGHKLIFHSHYSIQQGLVKFSTDSDLGQYVWELDESNVIK